MSELCALAASLLTGNGQSFKDLQVQQSVDWAATLTQHEISRKQSAPTLCHRRAIASPISNSMKSLEFSPAAHDSSVEPVNIQQTAPLKSGGWVNGSGSEQIDVEERSPHTRVLKPQMPLPSLPRPQLPVPRPATDNLPTLPPSSLGTSTARPYTNSQLYHQRWAALRAGRTYTRLAPDSFRAAWINATQQPSYQQWVSLLSHEAQAMARGQGQNRLTVLVGDSLSMWFPSDRLPSQGFVLNQGISGDTTAGVLQLLNRFGQTRPDRIHVMVGINDLRQGASDQAVLNNLRQIMRRLRQAHPQAQVVVHSILPTRLTTIPADRIASLNAQLSAITQHEGVQYLNLQTYFADEYGQLRQELTTDGLHLNPDGYAVWQSVWRQFSLV